MMNLVPVVTQLKRAYDDAQNYQEDFGSEAGYPSGGVDHDVSDGELSADEPPSKRHKSDPTGSPGINASQSITCINTDKSQGIQGQEDKPQSSGKARNKFVNKQRDTAKDIDPELAENITSYMSLGIDKDGNDIVMKKYLTPANCPRLGVVQVNPEMSFLNLHCGSCESECRCRVPP